MSSLIISLSTRPNMTTRKTSIEKIKIPINQKRLQAVKVLLVFVNLKNFESCVSITANTQIYARISPRWKKNYN